MHPATPGWGDAAMDVGQAFSDPLSNVTIQNVGQDASGATLLLNVPLDTVPPSAPGGLTAVAGGTSAVLHWTAASDDYSVDYYRVERDGVLGRSAHRDRLHRHGPRAGHDRHLQGRGGRRRRERRPLRRARTWRFPTPTPPSAPGRVTAAVTKDGSVHLAWGMATDNGQIALYRVRRNGKLIASGLGQAFVDKSARPGKGSAVNYSIVAVDLAGNAGPPGKARAVRAALLRKLRASGLAVARVTVGRRPLLRVRGTALRCRGALPPARRHGPLARLQAQGRRRLQRQHPGRGPDAGDALAARCASAGSSCRRCASASPSHKRSPSFGGYARLLLPSKAGVEHGVLEEAIRARRRCRDLRPARPARARRSQSRERAGARAAQRASRRAPRRPPGRLLDAAVDARRRLATRCACARPATSGSSRGRACASRARCATASSCWQIR